MPNKTRVICRPCKEEDNWEIVSPNGRTLKRHYDTKQSAVKAARDYAFEHGSELFIMDTESNLNSRQNRKSR